MKQRSALQKLFQGMRADVEDYRRLRELLEEQFEAIVRHRAEQVRDVVGRISDLASTLDARRRERVELARRLTPAGQRPSIVLIAAKLQGASRVAFDECWTSLEALARECKQLNERNCHVLMEQHEIMRRVLAQVARGHSAEADTYAPA